MAEHWWRTADGKLDADHRERARLLKALAEDALAHAEPFDVSDRPARAVDRLVASETLRDLGNDRVAFRHDVLREWAIASPLSSEADTVQRLPLDRPAPAILARGVELTARIALERTSDGTRWHGLLESLSREGIHGSWRRSVLLALVRSEIGPELLSRVSSLLFADGSRLLRELIRTVMAVDVEPASRLFARAGVDPAMIPASMNVPSGPSWYRLIVWLIDNSDRLPPAAIPDVVRLYTTWSTGMLGRDRLTPFLLQWLHHWLTEIGDVQRSSEALRRRAEPRADHRAESDLRTGFLLFCNRTPALAADYLRSLGTGRHARQAARGILKFSGALAQAAPAELMEFTAMTLIPEPPPDEPEWPPSRPLFPEPFDYSDHDFLPASPTQGPFFELLTHSPEHGLSLLRRLVDHAISFYAKVASSGDDAIVIPYPDGARAFPWVRSYRWSRDGPGHYCVTSALMALEAWGHRRIEAGEPFDKVLADVLGPAGDAVGLSFGCRRSPAVPLASISRSRCSFSRVPGVAVPRS